VHGRDIKRENTEERGHVHDDSYESNDTDNNTVSTITTIKLPDAIMSHQIRRSQIDSLAILFIPLIFLQDWHDHFPKLTSQ